MTISILKFIKEVNGKVIRVNRNEIESSLREIHVYRPNSILQTGILCLLST